MDFPRSADKLIVMMLSIDIAPQTEQRLRQQAEAAGKDVRQYVSEIVTQLASKPALEEILAPLRKRFAESGITEEELIADITEAQAEYRKQKRKNPA